MLAIVAYFDRPLVASLPQLSLISAKTVSASTQETFVICLRRNRRVREQNWDCNKDPALKRQTTVGA
jgi:hypothetical protein